MKHTDTSTLQLLSHQASLLQTHIASLYLHLRVSQYSNTISTHHTWMCPIRTFLDHTLFSGITHSSL